MRESWENGPAEREHINRWLAANCFGDYYTRSGLSDLDREMVTFCYIAAQGGCEPQATAHAGANLNLGRDRDSCTAWSRRCCPTSAIPAA